MSDPRRFEPTGSAVAAPFWEATREGRLVLPWCTACEKPHWFPRAICPHCGGGRIAWRAASGGGEVYALCIEHRSNLPAVFGTDPYVVALVELTEGVRLMTNIVNISPHEVRVGLGVTVTWEELSDGRRLPLFEPVAPDRESS